MKGLELNLLTDQAQHPQYLVRVTDGVIEEANDAFLELFGYARNQLGILKEDLVIEKPFLFERETETDPWVHCRSQSGSGFMMEKITMKLHRDDIIYSAVSLDKTNYLRYETGGCRKWRMNIFYPSPEATRCRRL